MPNIEWKNNLETLYFSVEGEDVPYEWVESFIVTLLGEVIKDSRYVFRHQADSFEEGEKHLLSKYLGK